MAMKDERGRPGPGGPPGPEGEPSTRGSGPPAAPDEQAIRRELLRGALEGYGDVLGGTGSDASGGAASSLPPMGAELIDQNLELLRDVNLQVKVELGRGKMYLRDILRLGQGSVVELERLAGDPLDIYVNDKVIARGEVLVLNENFCIRITQVFHPEELRQGT
jgi:flagellar motor switch protein FliN/FliY